MIVLKALIPGMSTMAYLLSDLITRMYANVQIPTLFFLPLPVRYEPCCRCIRNEKNNDRIPKIGNVRVLDLQVHKQTDETKSGRNAEKTEV